MSGRNNALKEFQRECSGWPVAQLELTSHASVRTVQLGFDRARLDSPLPVRPSAMKGYP